MPPSTTTPPSNPAMDHYTILGITPTASISEIKTAYRARREQYYTTDIEKYRACTEAYIALTNSEMRMNYDNALAKHNRGAASKNLERRDTPAAVSPLTKMVAETGHEVCESVSMVAAMRTLQVTSQDDAVACAYSGVIYHESGLLCHSPEQLSRCSSPEPQKTTFYPTPSKIPVLQGYGGRARHGRLLCARPRHVVFRKY